LQVHFRTLHKPVDVAQPVFGYSEQPGPRLEELYREQRNTVLQLTSPRVTLGLSPERELSELFDRFVAGTTAKPAEPPHLAPSALRRQVDGWLDRRGLLGRGLYQRNIQATGTVAPWIFDFGLRNGQLTLVQTLALSAPIQVGLDRALLLHARAADVKAVERGPVDFVVIADTVEREAPAVRYLTNHELEVLPADDKQRVEERLSRALHVMR